MTDLNDRLSAIQKLGTEFTKEVGTVIQTGSPMYYTDLFAIGATNRTLAQSRGFRSMIIAKNFSSAAILLRTQIDTVMRVNGLRYLDDPETQLRDAFEGRKTFRELVSWQKTKKGKPERMTDVFLLERLQEDETWIKPIYKETSDFVHLSFRHLFGSIQSTNDKERTVNFAITGEDNISDESSYYEICDAFFRVSKLTYDYVLEVLVARHTQS